MNERKTDEVPRQGQDEGNKQSMLRKHEDVEEFGFLRALANKLSKVDMI